MVYLFGKEFAISIAFVGLAGSGKSTLINTLRKLTPDQNTTVTTRGMNIEVLSYERSDRSDMTEFLAIDLGGQSDLIESIWQQQIEKCQAVVFMFDGINKKSVLEAKKWLFKVAEWIRSETSLLFLCNKNDTPQCMNLDDAIATLDLTTLLEMRPHSLGIYHVSGLYNRGIPEAFDWLINKVQSDLKQKTKP